MLSFFGHKEKSAAGGGSGERVPRHSSGWTKLLERMRTDESLRVLDFGPTSPTNINFVTALGHSIYLANLVEDAARREWIIPSPEGGSGSFDVERFLAAHLDFSGRGFDLVLLWDTADYLPQELLAAVIDRIHAVMSPGGQILAMFHATPAPGSGQRPKGDFSRYHLTDSSTVEVQRAGDYPILHTYTNRQIETLFQAFRSYHFLLTKDNVREVVVTR